MTPANDLLIWYNDNYRDLPWRKTKNPYRIWISEVMLQQTRAVAVIPYYKNFLKRFPNIQALADAEEKEVLEAWAGLGYYSRAKNLHKAAKHLKNKGFPQSYEELLKIPSFGPYTARAVASFAFGQNCAVLDGNVIRFLTRYYGLSIEWWKPQARRELQKRADAWVENQESATVNQALMEMGATVCTSSSPACLLCPVASGCKAKKHKKIEQLPMAKPKRKKEIWYLEFQYIESTKGLALSKTHACPFLKGEYLFPVRAKQLDKKPDAYIFKHAITHHEIYIGKINKQKASSIRDKKQLEWFDEKHITKTSPFSLTTKVKKYADKNL
tara:strand:+ start:20361 stop:21341 length:981 start_codon:yes stop_codon:yes gene_type:complete